MSMRRARNIAVGATLVIGGVVTFGFVRRKKLLYSQVKKNIAEYGGGYTGTGDLNMDTTGCSLTQAQALTAAERLFEAMDGAGTDENVIMNVTEEAQTRACWNKIALAYYDLTDGGNLRDDITNELENWNPFNTELDDWEDTFTTLR